MDAADTSTAAAPEQPIATPPAPEAAQTSPTPETASEPSAPGAKATQPDKAPDPKDRAAVIRSAVKASQEPAEGKTLRDKMIERGVIRPAGEPARTPDGKFAPAAAAAQPQAAKPAATPAATTAAALPLPKALKAELGPIWAKTPAEMQAAVARYVEDATKGIEKYRSAAQTGEALLAEFRPYEAILRAEGGTPATAIRSLLNTAYVLRTGNAAQKAMLIAQTMQQFGVTPETVGMVLQGQAPQAQAPDPRYAQLERQVQEMRSALEGRTEQQYASIASAFGRDKPHWELMKPHVAAILSRGEIEGADQMSETEILEAAYNRALSQYPVVSQAQAEAERQAALKAERNRANAAAAASRQAAVQVTGAPGGAAAAAFDPKDRRSVLRHALTAQTR